MRIALTCGALTLAAATAAAQGCTIDEIAELHDMGFTAEHIVSLCATMVPSAAETVTGADPGAVPGTVPGTVPPKAGAGQAAPAAVVPAEPAAPPADSPWDGLWALVYMDANIPGFGSYADIIRIDLHPDGRADVTFWQPSLGSSYACALAPETASCRPTAETPAHRDGTAEVLRVEATDRTLVLGYDRRGSSYDGRSVIQVEMDPSIRPGQIAAYGLWQGFDISGAALSDWEIHLVRVAD